MKKTNEACPAASDIEPTCFDFDASVAWNHAQTVCEALELPRDAVQPAIGLVIPNQDNSYAILYGLRSSVYHTEFKDTWGLPSIGLTREELFQLGEPGPAGAILARLSQRKLGGVRLEPDRIVGWTGRIRLTRNDPQFTHDYYLVMVDIKTTPVDPRELPPNSDAYTQLRWLTPKQHTEIVQTSPQHACGACSELASLADRLGRL